MSWRFPHFTLPEGSVVDIEDFNRGLQITAGEIGGKLNEHNWRNGAFRRGVAGNTGGTAAAPPSVVGNGFRDTCEPGAAYNWWTPGQTEPGAAFTWSLASDIGHDIMGSYINVLAPDEDPDNPQTTPETLGWKTILQANIVSDGGLLWVMASFQIENRAQTTDFALRVDGAIIGESKVATAELENDIKGAVNYLWLYPITIDTIVHVTDGPHIVELLSRELEFISATNGWGDGSVSSFGNRSLIVLEIRR